MLANYNLSLDLHYYVLESRRQVCLPALVEDMLGVVMCSYWASLKISSETNSLVKLQLLVRNELNLEFLINSIP